MKRKICLIVFVFGLLSLGVRGQGGSLKIDWSQVSTQDIRDQGNKSFFFEVNTSRVKMEDKIIVTYRYEIKAGNMKDLVQKVFDVKEVSDILDLNSVWSKNFTKEDISNALKDGLKKEGFTETSSTYTQIDDSHKVGDVMDNKYVILKPNYLLEEKKNDEIKFIVGKIAGSQLGSKLAKELEDALNLPSYPSGQLTFKPFSLGKLKVEKGFFKEDDTKVIGTINTMKISHHYRYGRVVNGNYRSISLDYIAYKHWNEFLLNEKKAIIMNLKFQDYATGLPGILLITIIKLSLLQNCG